MFLFSLEPNGEVTKLWDNLNDYRIYSKRARDEEEMR